MFPRGLSEVVPYNDLARLTAALTADPRWPGPAVTVLPLRDRRLWGRAWRHTVRYAPEAPAWVPIHELAHIASGDYGHGSAWRAWAVELAGWLSSQQANCGPSLISHGSTGPTSGSSAGPASASPTTTSAGTAWLTRKG